MTLAKDLTFDQMTCLAEIAGPGIMDTSVVTQFLTALRDRELVELKGRGWCLTPRGKKVLHMNLNGFLLDIQRTSTELDASLQRQHALKFVWSIDPLDTQAWCCPDCASWATIGGNAAYHATTTGHCVPVLGPIPQLPPEDIEVGDTVLYHFHNFSQGLWVDLVRPAIVTSVHNSHLNLNVFFEVGDNISDNTEGKSQREGIVEQSIAEGRPYWTRRTQRRE